MPVEFREPFICHAAVGQNGFDLVFSQNQGLRRLFVLLCQLCESFVDTFYHFYIAVLAKGVLDKSVKGFFLTACGQGKGAVKEGFHKAFFQLLRIFGIVQQAVDIRASVVEGREEEACLRQGHHPVPHPVLKSVLLRIVAQARLGQFHGTDAGQYVFVHLVGGVIHLNSVGGLSGHVVDIVDHQDQVVSHIFITFNDLIIIFFQQGVVFQPALPQAQQKFLCVFLPVLVLGEGVLDRVLEFQCQQVSAGGSGQGFAQDLKIFEHFFLGKGQKGLL